MSAESTLYGYLSGHAALTSLVSTRIYPDAMPEETAMPAVVFARLATDPTYNLGGTLLCEDVQMSIAGWAKTPDEADAIAVAITGALTAHGEATTGRESGFDPEVGLYVRTVATTLLINA